MRKIFLILLSVILLSSCVYRSPFEDGAVFASMGGEEDLVITIDMARAKESSISELLPSSVITERSDRLSVSVSSSSFYGAAEGNFGYASVNAFFDWVPDWRRSEGDLRYYTSRSSGLEAAVPESGVLLFTSSSYPDVYDALIERRIAVIDRETEALMNSSLAAMYTRNAALLSDLGLGITENVADNIEEVVFLFEDGAGSLSLSGWLDMDSPSSARTLVTVLRNELIQGIRERGERPDFQALSKLYYQEGDKVMLSSVTVSAGQVESMLSILEEF